MSNPISPLLDVPLDILLMVFPYLDAKSFLALCSTCRGMRDHRFEPSYWSHATRTTFRVPNQPVVQHDGLRWQKMYKRLLTQSRVFTWGQNGHSRLGHTGSTTIPPVNPTVRRHRWHRVLSDCPFPVEMDASRNLGIVADMQCGGWSTTILTSKGELYSTGVLDGQRLQQPRPTSGGASGPQELDYPSAYPKPGGQSPEPSTSIRQFSSGRSHILGLSDSGRIWSWYDLNDPGLHVRFMHINTHEISSENPKPSLYGRVKQVVAGWSVSSAYIYGVGIVLWSPVERDHGETDTDGMMVIESVEVPQTRYRRPRDSSRESDENRALGQEVGEVLNYIVLENFVVFVTDIGKVFAGRIDGSNDESDDESNKVKRVFELRELRNHSGSPSDVQGAFRTFALFKDGEVLIISQDYLRQCCDSDSTDVEQVTGVTRIPCLQHNDVISVSFGDYHFLALHSNGKITSYGKELRGCGALGLGGEEAYQDVLRGVHQAQFSSEGQLVPHAYTHGREVWFEKEKRDWLRFMMAGGCDPTEAAERVNLTISDATVQGEVSEWFEQEGRDWDRRPEAQEALDIDDDGLGAYFALSVSAAGWHSGALVLVNEKLVDRVHEICLQRSPSSEPESVSDDSRLRNPQLGYKWENTAFPRLLLSNGQEMPGTVELSSWRFGRPEWQLDVVV